MGEIFFDVVAHNGPKYVERAALKLNYTAPLDAYADTHLARDVRSRLCAKRELLGIASAR